MQDIKDLGMILNPENDLARIFQDLGNFFENAAAREVATAYKPDYWSSYYWWLISGRI